MKPFFDLTLPRGGDHILSGPVAIVLGIGIFASVAIAQAIQSIEIRRETADFQLAAEQTIGDIEDRVDGQIELIRSIVSLFNSSERVERGEFQSFVADSLRRHPSIQLVGWIPRVPGDRRVQFEADARREGLTDYQINERSIDRRVISAPPRAEYFPNLFLEPPPATAGTYGLDQSFEPIRRVALERARDIGELVFSARTELALVTDENRTAIIAAQMDDVYFPITLKEFGARIYFRDLRQETFTIDSDIQIETLLLSHPGYCLGYRINFKGRSICYVTDNELYLDDHPSFNPKYVADLTKFVAGMDILITDTTYFDPEYKTKIDWGHSCVSKVVELADAAQVKSLHLFHHDPDQDDAAIDRKLSTAQEAFAARKSTVECVAPAEGGVFYI